MSISMGIPGQASTFLTHYFGRGLVDEDRRYAVERFKAMTQRRYPPLARRDAGDEERPRPAQARGRVGRRGSGHATRAQRDHRVYGAGHPVRCPVLGVLRLRIVGRPHAEALSGTVPPDLPPAPAGRPTPSFHLRRRTPSWRIRIPKSAGRSTASVLAGGPPSVSPRACVRAAASAGPHPVAVCAIPAASNAVWPTATAPRNAGPPGSGASGTPTPGNPNMPVPGSGPPIVLRRGFARSAVGTRPSRPAACAQLAVSSSACPSAPATGLGKPPTGHTAGAMRHPNAARPAGGAGNASVRAAKQACASDVASILPWTAAQAASRALRRAGRPNENSMLPDGPRGCADAAARRRSRGIPRCGPCVVFEAGHQPRKNAANRARYTERRARWICTHCGRRQSFGASRCEPCRKRAHERSEHVRGLPVYPPSFTIVDLETGQDHGTWDSWEDVLLALSFARLSLEQVEVISDQSPMQPMLTGLS